MKKNKIRPSISKFRIAKLNRPDYIIGGGDDDGTVSDPDEDKCKMKSKVIVQ